MLDARFLLSLRNAEDLLHERGIDVSHATVRFWWNMLIVKINGRMHYLWRGVDQKGQSG